MTKLKAPFPYFGGKSRIAGDVWRRFGEVTSYVEPFCGSAAMLLAAPSPARMETVNDADGFGEGEAGGGDLVFPALSPCGRPTRHRGGGARALVLWAGRQRLG